MVGQGPVEWGKVYGEGGLGRNILDWRMSMISCFEDEEAGWIGGRRRRLEVCVEWTGDEV